MELTKEKKTVAKEVVKLVEPSKTAVKLIHMQESSEIIGGTSKTMKASKNLTLEMIDCGVRMHSKSSGRVVVIPFGNIRAFELFV